MQRIFFPAIFLLLLILPACAKKVDLGPGYQKTSKQFLQALRWKDYRRAGTYLKEGEGQKLVAHFEELSDLQIAEAEYRYSQLDEKTQSAKSGLVLRYFRLPSTRIEEWSWEIDWELLPADSQQLGTWQIRSAPEDYPGD